MIRIPAKSEVRAVLVLVLAVAYPGELPGQNREAPGAAAEARALWKEGAVLHVEGRYHEAIDRFRGALALHPTARSHTYLAWSLSGLGRYEEAAAQTRKAIELDPEYPNAYNDLGAYLIELGRPADAMPWLVQAIGMPQYCCPHYSYYQIGRALLVQGHTERAKEALARALVIKPRYRAARSLLHRIRSGGFQGL